jgi:hypothetical protein
MTTSRETEHLDHEAIRKLVDEADTLPLPDRMTLLKGLVPGIVREMSPEDWQAFAMELRLKGERFFEAERQPGQGRASRQVIGERDLEGR